jgi:predicted membrane protein (TIGR00267 family)
MNVPNPVRAAISSGVSTAGGAIVPVLPFFWLDGLTAIFVAAAVSMAAHFLVGAAKSLITARRWWASGLEMTGVGALEGAVTYGLGLAAGKLL